MVLSTYFADADSDGFGSDDADAVMACLAPMGFVERAGDCDDSRDDVNPDGEERCDTPLPGEDPADENCDRFANPPSVCGMGSPGGFRHNDYTFFAVVQAVGVTAVQTNYLELVARGLPDGSEWGFPVPVMVAGVDI